MDGKWHAEHPFQAVTLRQVVIVVSGTGLWTMGYRDGTPNELMARQVTGFPGRHLKPVRLAMMRLARSPASRVCDPSPYRYRKSLIPIWMIPFGWIKGLSAYPCPWMGRGDGAGRTTVGRSILESSFVADRGDRNADVTASSYAMMPVRRFGRVGAPQDFRRER